MENTHDRESGFTLVELMVTVLIATILVSIAVPSYTSQVRKSRRTEAKTALLDLAGREERYYNTTNLGYSATPSDLGYGTNFPISIGGGYYTIAPPIIQPGSTTALASFVITATPTAIGNQIKDTQCASFTVTSTGVQSSLDSANGDSSATCWK